MALRFAAFTLACFTFLCPLHAQGPPGSPGSPGGPPVPEELTVQVDCDAGDSLQAALDQRADRLTVEFSGTCAEDVTIARDDVTLRGRVGALVAGDPSAPSAPGLTVTGGSRVVLEDFTVSDDDTRGILVQDGAAVDVARIVSRDNPSSGLSAFGSFVRVTDSRFLDNGFLGIGLWGMSSLWVRGVVEVSRNVAGLSLSAGSGAQGDLGPERLVAIDNSFIGVNLQLASEAQLETVLVRGSTLGISLFDGCSLAAEIDVSGSLIGMFLTGASSLGFDGTVSDNAFWGILCQRNSVLNLAGDFSLPPTVSVSGNGDAGIQMLEGCVGHLGSCRAPQPGDPGPCGSQGGQLTVTGNGRVGIEIDASSATLENASLSGNGTDLQLAFGARTTFGPGNALGIVTCDGTVLTRGASVCPPAASLRFEAPRSDLPPEVRDLLQGGGAPFRFQP